MVPEKVTPKEPEALLETGTMPTPVVENVMVTKVGPEVAATHLPERPDFFQKYRRPLPEAVPTPPSTVYVSSFPLNFQRFFCCHSTEPLSFSTPVCLLRSVEISKRNLPETPSRSSVPDPLALPGVTEIAVNVGVQVVSAVGVIVVVAADEDAGVWLPVQDQLLKT